MHPATAERWKDLEALFGPKGACAGCWCMFWRQRASEFRELHGDGNRKLMKKLLARETPPGVIAYVGGEPAGWCAVAPREEFIRLETSRVLKPVDDQPVWSITCFFVARPFRLQGMTVRLLRAGLDFARARGARIVEGYPVEPGAGPVPDVFAYTGLASAFRKAGFKEVARRSKTRPFMRCALPSSKKPAGQTRSSAR
jgi:GNAT superfamily N-acetyltransferase